MARSALATTKLRVFEARRGFDFAALCAFTRAWIDLLHSRDTTSFLCSSLMQTTYTMSAGWRYIVSEDIEENLYREEISGKQGGIKLAHQNNQPVLVARSTEIEPVWQGEDNNGERVGRRGSACNATKLSSVAGDTVGNIYQ